MWKNILPVILIAAVIFISGCISTQTSQQAVVCNPPYIKVGTECCLDQNYNNICDKDEQPTTPAQTQQPTQTQSYCGDNTCDSTESCSTCPSDCGLCPPQKETIAYSDANSQISVSDFRYTGINCNGGICREAPNSAILAGDGYYSKSYSFKINYVPTSNKNMYFEAYTTDLFNSISTGGISGSAESGFSALALIPGENTVFMGSSLTNFNEAPNVKLCFSYIKFYISNDRGVAKFYKSGTALTELDSTEYVCINKIFDPPQISVQANSVNFNLNAVGYQTNQVIYGEQTITITNTGKVPQVFSIFVPNKNDGTSTANNRPTTAPDFYYKIKADGTVDWQHYLQPGQSYTFTLTTNLVYQQNMQTYYTDTGYVYTIPTNCSGIFLATCYTTAGWSQPFTITTAVTK